MSTGAGASISKIPELRKRILFTIFILAIYRLGAHVPTPGIDTAALAAFFDRASGTIFGIFNMFSGGALKRFSVFALGIMPYISASIIMQLLTVVVPALEKLSKEGDLGRRKITQYTRYGTIVLCIVQGLFIATGLESMKGPAGEPVVLNPGIYFKFLTIITLTTGTTFIMWLGEQITERGIGNGISLIIYAGIAAGIPSGFSNSLSLMKSGQITAFAALFILAVMIAVIAFIIFMERAQRRIPVQYAKRVIGRKLYGGQSAHLPLKINSAGVIPPIFASSIIIFPATIAQYIDHPFFNALKEVMQSGSMVYMMVYVGLIVFFTYFYTAVTFNPVDVAENLKRHGGFIPGIRPGKSTSDYIDRVLTKITLAGALYIAAVCVLPEIMISKFKVPFYFGGTSLLILIGVALDTVSQIESYLITRHYDGFMKNARLRGRRG
ncbi:MAG: preprotein translocase subunit SecY [Oligoflexia bacterium]|nr:preprotein translocase subunit SecY [Oligoflexia bacterium]